jgi:hypothetical protein
MAGADGTRNLAKQRGIRAFMGYMRRVQGKGGR